MPFGNETAALAARAETPLALFLQNAHERIAQDHRGNVADYIPKLGEARPEHFGLCLATLDGHVHACGDADVPFTIQSISKAFVFALALDILGPAAVEAAIGVEPSGEAFNSVRLGADNRPFNAMVNSGAITCAAMIRDAEGEGAWGRVSGALSAFAGRTLSLDEAIYNSETETGDRNRAIAYLLRNAGRFRSGVNDALDVYFRQCSLLVTARDLSVMAATLANGGLNPVTGIQVVSTDAVYRTMSVMASSGMYDFSGEWIYRVGLPAKSGVGGGIIAVMPGQLGLGSFSPPLDELGNSVRGLRVCEELSASYHLHLLNPAQGPSRCILADYTGNAAGSRRERRPEEAQCLLRDKAGVRVLELYGTLTFADIDFVARSLRESDAPRTALILDLHRVSGASRAGAKLLGDLLAQVTASGTQVAMVGRPSGVTVADDVAQFALLDDAVEWVEDELLARHADAFDSNEIIGLAEQSLLAGLSVGETSVVSEIGEIRWHPAGATIVSAGGQADSVYFLMSGTVSIRLKGGQRVATLAAGSAFGEMALLRQPRSADVVADTEISCLELSVDRLVALQPNWPRIEPTLMRNLGLLLADRLRQTNAKLQLLRA
jgi:glutaminase